MKHHALIRSLIEEIRRLRKELEDANEYAESLEWSAGRAEERASAASREARRQAQLAAERESDANYRFWEQERALKDLERARQWGNEYEEQKALNKLKGLM